VHSAPAKVLASPQKLGRDMAPKGTALQTLAPAIRRDD